MRNVWFPRVMSNRFCTTVYLSLFILKQCIVFKTTIRCSLSKCYQPRPWARLLTLITSTLIIPYVTKTSSNNCLLMYTLLFWTTPNKWNYWNTAVWLKVVVISGIFKGATFGQWNIHVNNGPYAWLYQTSKFHLKAKLFTFALFGPKYCFQLFCLGNSYMQNVASFQLQKEAWWWNLLVWRTHA